MTYTLTPVDRFSPEFQAKVKAWWARVADIKAALDLDEENGDSIEAWQGPGGYDGEPIIKVFRGRDDMTGTTLKSQPKQDGYRRADESHPRRGEVVRWLEQADVRWSDFLTSIKVQMRTRPLTAKQVDAVARTMDKVLAKDAERAAQRTVQPAAKPERVTEDGMYQKDGVIYKVQRAVHGSGNLYAKRLVVHGPGSASFEYEQGAIARLTPADRMTLEQAQDFGHLYGVCCQCGRTLTDEVSISRGIGPVCAGKL